MSNILDVFLISYVTGNTYSGEWKCNARHGEGTMKWLKLGQQYVGNWCEGLQVRQISHQLSSAVVRTFDVDINAAKRVVVLSITQAW